MTRGACLIRDPGRGWRGIVFVIGSTGKYLYETQWHKERLTAKSEVDGWLTANNVRARWLADSAPPREQ